MPSASHHLDSYRLGSDALVRARASSRMFTRSQDHLALATPNSGGHRLTAIEALEAFGLEKLQEALDYGSAILPPSQDEPAMTLKRRREALGLSIAELATSTGLGASDIEDCEDPQTRSPIKSIRRLAETLGLDERLISFRPGAEGDDTLAVRLKAEGGAGSLKPAAVIALSDASWIVKTEHRLRHDLGQDARLLTSFTPSENYGSPGYPTWRQGYFLAQRTRERLGIQPLDPIPSVRKICERLGIPILQTDLPKHIAGATVVSGGHRGIIVNREGRNSNVWVRRATMAHELGHLLWDADERLNRVRVDSYEELDSPSLEQDVVEARANAFAIALLAPLGATADVFRSRTHEPEGVRAVMEKFGISFTAARFHIGNAIDRPLAMESSRLDIEPTMEWEGQESFSILNFPIETTPPSRQGNFAGVVLHAKRAGLISVDTAADFLQTTPAVFLEKEASLVSMFGEQPSRAG